MLGKNNSIVALCLLMMISVVGCDSGSQINTSSEPIHKITLEDGGEIVFYETEPGELSIMFCTESADMFAALNTMNCIEMCEKYGGGFVPEALREAYDRNVALYGVVDYSDEQEDELPASDLVVKASISSKDYLYGHMPNWTFETFAQQTEKWSPGMIEGNYHLNYLIENERDYEVRYLMNGYHKNFTYDKSNVEISAACYVVSGEVDFKIRHYWTKDNWVIGPTKWRTLQYKKVNPGWFVAFRESNDHKLRVFANAKTTNTRYHLFVRAKN